MFEYIIGKIVAIKDDYLVLDNNQIGYKIFTSSNTLSKVNVNEEVKMYIYYNLRDDGVYLYGFYDEEELEMFNLLLLVSKIGPRNGLNVLSTLTPNQIKLAIINDDSYTLCRAPGIGNKTSSRIILELKDRISIDDLGDEDEIISVQSSEIDTAIEALMSFGYSRREVMYQLRKIDTDNMKAEDIIRESLKSLSK